MRENTRNTLHLGVNFVVTPAPSLDTARQLRFAERLSEEQIEFSQFTRQGNNLVFVREPPSPLQVQVSEVTPVTGQLLIISAVQGVGRPVAAGTVTPKVFRGEAEMIVAVFREVWPEVQQVLSRDSAVHALYDSGGQHAFQYLWESRLGQSEESLEVFGRLLGGGGLRLVFPGDEAQGTPTVTEVKIESYLNDSSKVYLDVANQWHSQGTVQDMDAGRLIDEVEDFMHQKVIPFVTSKQ